jgi:predicted transcriptional regulator
MIFGYKTTQALYVAAKLGLPDHLVSGPRSVEEFAREVGANHKALLRLMRHLIATGVFKQYESKKFSLTPLGKLLRNDGAESMRYNAIYAGGENYKATRRVVAFCPSR